MKIFSQPKHWVDTLTKPKTAYFDIETAPALALAWGGKMYEEDLLEIVEPWYILCFSVRWSHEKRTRTYTIADSPDFKKNPRSDRWLCEQLRGVFHEADVLIGHNSIRFDERKARARFNYWRMPPPSPSKSADTLMLAKSQFDFTSNKLNDLGVFLGLGAKKETGGFKLWKAARNGDVAALRKMGRYCSRDVDLLVDVFERLAPYAKRLPRMISHDSENCPVCHSHEIQRRGYETLTSGNKKQRLQCQDCGHWWRDVKLIKGKK